MSSMYENEINEFFHYVSSQRPENCGSIRLIVDKPDPNTCSGTDFCNYELRQLLLHGDKSIFYNKSEDEIQNIINKNSANRRTDLGHLSKIRKCWNSFIKNKNINFTFGFSNGLLKIKYK